jgi:hypothetical protein
MPGPSLTGAFISRLKELKIPYVITGAVASIIYGEPRLTHDLDLIVMMQTGDMDIFVQAFASTFFLIVCFGGSIPKPFRQLTLPISSK